MSEVLAHELTADTTAELIRPALDKFVAGAEPYLRKVSEELYEKLLWSVQDYLRENSEWNIGEEIARCRRIEHDNTQLRVIKADMLNAMRGVQDILSRAESNASGNPEWDVVNDRITYFRHVLTRAEEIDLTARRAA